MTQQQLFPLANRQHIDRSTLAPHQARIHLGQILNHPTGGGKTVSYMAAIDQAFPNQGFKALFVGSKNAMVAYMNLIPRWWGVKPIQIEGTYTRQKLWEQIFDPNVTEGIWMITYGTLRADKKLLQTKYAKYFKAGAPKVLDVLVLDEAHKVTNRKTQSWEAVELINRTVKHRIAGSATLIKRSPHNLWAILNLYNPKYFRSYWKFVNTYCEVLDTGYGKEIVGAKNVDALKELLAPIVDKATVKEVYGDKPTVIREKVVIEPTKQQKRLISDLIEENLLILPSDELLVTPNALSVLMRVRQMAISPWIFGYDEPGALVEYILERLEEDPHTVIFSPFKGVFQRLENHLRSKGHEVQVITGEKKPAEVIELAAEHKATKGIALVSVSYAESYALDTTHTAYMLGFDWDPNVNIQAEGRLRRMDSTMQDACLVQYLVAAGTYDSHVLQALDMKQNSISEFWHIERPKTVGDLKKLLEVSK